MENKEDKIPLKFSDLTQEKLKLVELLKGNYSTSIQNFNVEKIHGYDVPETSLTSGDSFYGD